MLTADNEAPRPYPRLSAAQIERVLSEVARYFAMMERFRLVRRGTGALEGAQLDLFSHRKEEQ
jgi:hypothetical protein